METKNMMDMLSKSWSRRMYKNVLPSLKN